MKGGTPEAIYREKRKGRLVPIPFRRGKKKKERAAFRAPRQWER